MKQMIVLSGISGSGKSTLAAEYEVRALADGLDFLAASANDFFMTRNGYVFDRMKLEEAHARCFRRCLGALESHFEDDNTDVLVVDNTNTTMMEIVPYMLAAKAYEWGWEVEIVTLMCATDAEVEHAISRNKHGVSLATGFEQQRRLQERRLPRRWAQKIMPVTFGEERLRFELPQTMGRSRG